MIDFKSSCCPSVLGARPDKRLYFRRKVTGAKRDLRSGFRSGDEKRVSIAVTVIPERIVLPSQSSMIARFCAPTLLWSSNATEAGGFQVYHDRCHFVILEFSAIINGRLQDRLRSAIYGRA